MSGELKLSDLIAVARSATSHWLEILVFIGLVALVYFGTGAIPLPKDNQAGALMLAVFPVGFLFYVWNSKNERIRLLEHTILVAAAENGTFLALLRGASVGRYSETRDLPLAICLERQTILGEFARPTGSMMSMFDSPGTREAEGLIDRWKFTGLYRGLDKMDKIMIRVLPRSIQEAFPNAAYFIRLNELDHFADMIVNQLDVVFGECDPGMEALHDLRRRFYYEYFRDTPKASQYPPVKTPSPDLLRSVIENERQDLHSTRRAWTFVPN